MKPVRLLSSLSSARLFIPLLGLGALWGPGASVAEAANSRWTGFFDGDWTNPLNWTAGVPGLPGGASTTTDLAVFGTSGTTATTADAGRNLFSLNFDNAAGTPAAGADAFVILGGPIVMSASTSLPSVLVNGMFGQADQTIVAPVMASGIANSNDLIIGTSSGYLGTLTLAGGLSSAGASGTSMVTFRTGHESDVALAGPVTNGTGTNLLALNLATSNNGTVTLSGASTFSGNMTVNNGRLVFDYSSGTTTVNGSQTMTIGTGTIVFKGAPTGTTAQTMDAAAGNDLVTLQSTGGTLVVDRNGGAGTTLTLGSTWSRASGSTMLFDVSSGGTIVSNPALRNGIATTSASAGVAGFFVKDATGTGFATVTAGNLARFTGATELAGTGSATGNFKTTGFTLTGLTQFNTLELDASNAADSRVLDLGANNLSPQQGLGILVTGANDFSIVGTGIINNNSILYHGGTGTLTIGVGSSGGTTKAGPGLVVFEKDFNAISMQGGISRIGGGTGGTGNLAIASGAILELGADLNGAGTAGDFTRGLGGGAGQVQIIGSGGFSAFGGTRVVNIGGAGAVMSWGGSVTSNLLNGVLVFSSEKSDSTLEFQNPLSFSGFDRAIEVNNGSADVDARLTGALSNGGAASGFYKAGEGTLELAAPSNPFTGNTRVGGGRLLLTGAISGSNALIIESGATVELGLSERLNDTAKVRLEGGTLDAAGFSETVGVLTLAGTATLDLGSGASVFRFGDSSLANWSGSLSITDWDGSTSGGGLDQVIFGFSEFSLLASQVEMIQFINPAGFAPGIYPAEMLPSGEVVATIPEPSSAVALLGGLGMLMVVSRFRGGKGKARVC